MRILIVDDAADNRFITRAMLSKAGYQDITAVSSADEAFMLLDEAYRTNEVPVDLILMDLMLPEITGIEACRIITGMHYLKDVPIIMVTASNEVENLRESFEAGAIDFVRKPFNRVELVSRVRNALRRKSEIDQRKAREASLLELQERLEAANDQLTLLSTIDAVTGISNRRELDDRLSSEWVRALRERYPIGILLLDIDSFKSYNDTYGHQQGDVCLREVAGSIKSTLHRPADFAARYGGEEFAALLPNTHNDGVKRIAEKVRRAIMSLAIPHAASQTAEMVTVSIGATAMLPRRGINHQYLVEIADRALYQSKGEGRNRVTFVDPFGSMVHRAGLIGDKFSPH